jgi:hypothetical protein
MEKWLIEQKKLECGKSGTVFCIDTGSNALIWCVDDDGNAYDIRMLCKDIHGNVSKHHFESDELDRLNRSFYALSYNWLEPTMGAGDRR